MTLVTIDIHYIHLGKDQGASGRHQDCLHSLLENMRVVSAWVTIVHWSVEGGDLVLTSHKQKSFKQTPHTACRDSEEQR